MSMYSRNPSLLLRHIFAEGTAGARIIALATIALGVAGVGLSSLPGDIRILSTEPTFLRWIGRLLAGVAFVLYLYLDGSVQEQEETQIESRLTEAQRAVDEHPDKAAPVWHLARTRLELYFQRNLSQSRSIFWITILVMLIGFAFMVYGVKEAFTNSNFQPALLATAAGVLTEFIAATFLVIYRSTLGQATELIKTLERINSVGMSIQILDTIDDDDKKLLNQARADLAQAILSSFSMSGVGNRKRQ